MNREEIEKRFKKHLINVNIYIEENKQSMHSNSTYKITISNGTVFVSCELYDKPLNDGAIKDMYILKTCEQMAMSLGKMKYFIE